MSTETDFSKFNTGRGLQMEPLATGYADEFPPTPNSTPFSFFCIVGKARTSKVSSGGIIFVEETLELDQFTAQAGKILAVGPMFYNRLDFKSDMPEEMRPKVGDIVTFKKFQGYRFSIPAKDEAGNLVKEGNEQVLHEYLLLRDADIYMKLNEGESLGDYKFYS